jgi:type IV pilus assembly protein PilX
MMPRFKKNPHVLHRKHQSGMTLMVGLILLLMLTVISTIGFRNTTLSERMTGNSVDRNVSFQSAESAGKEALQVIESGLFNAATLGHYAVPISQGGTSTFWTQGDGAAGVANCATNTPFSWRSCSANVAARYANNAANAQYVIELLTQVSSGGQTISTYRVTSRSTGGSGNADVVLQIQYVRTTTP